MWTLIDVLKDKGTVELDYLQIFKLKKEGDLIIIEHEQEVPKYKSVHLIEVDDIQLDEAIKIYVIDDGDIIKSQIPDFNGKIELPNFNMTAPVYCEAYLDLISRIVANPLDHYDILRYLDFIMMEYNLNSKDIDIDEMKVYFDNYNKLNKSAKALLHFICTITNLPLNIFNILK